ncbi:tetratricopeptide repeat protein [Streptomyces sp. PA03-6a]|nr:tetratricopeptide repeat protein [Streptomyces sp. PA03-6a]
MEHLITLDDSGRMVATDRAALARAVAELLDGPLDRPEPLRRAGLGHLVLGRHEEAVALLERSLALAGERFAVAVHLNLADAHRYAGALDAAEPHYQRALRLAEAHAPDLLSFCFQHLGKQRLDQGRTEEARAWLEKALHRRRVQGEASLVAATEAALRLVDRSGHAASRRPAPGGAAGPSVG